MVLDCNLSLINKLKEFNSPHDDVRLFDLQKVYTLDTVRMNTEDDGVLVGNVDTGTFTDYTHRNKYYYSHLKPVM